VCKGFMLGMYGVTNGAEVSGGSLTCNWLDVGRVNQKGGNGHLLVTGGQITVNGKLGVPNQFNTAVDPEKIGVGHIDLFGGTIIAGNFVLGSHQVGLDGGIGTMDVTEGILIVNGDKTTDIQTWIDNGWITSGGTGVPVVLYDADTNTTTLASEDLESAPTIIVEAGGDIAAANAGAVAGDIIGIAVGTYAITEAIEIKDGVTYRGAGSGQTIIDCQGVTRAFVGWGDRSQNDDLPYSETGYPDNTSGPKDWVIRGLSIINGVADDVDKVVQRVGDPAIDPPLTANVVLDPFKVTDGGGIFLMNYAEGTLIDVAFDNCNALATGVDTTDPNFPTTYLGSGGAVGIGWATVNIVDCTFTNNNASNDGGAVFATNPAMENWDLSIENSTFTDNSARDDGGAIYAVRRNLTVTNCSGNGNKTGLDPAIMEDNASGDPDGGFIYTTGAGKVAGTSYTEDTPPLEMTNYGGIVTVTGCTIDGGSARRAGGVRTNGAAQLFVADSTFTNCVARGNDGGAIFANGPSPFNPAVVDVNDPNVGEPGVYIDGVAIDGCIAEDDGGGINIDNWSTGSGTNYLESPKVVISNSVITNCRAGGPAPDDGNRDGGGIRTNQRLTVTITNTVVDNCTAGRHGAGIVIDGRVDALLMDGCQISNCANDAISGEGGDGAAMNVDTDANVGLMISNCIFNNNVNNQDDGVVRIDAHEGFFYNCTFVGNVTGDQGIIRFNTSEDDASVQNGVINCLFVNNDHSPGSDQLIAHNKGNVTYTYTNNAFFGNIGDGDPLIDSIADADLGLTFNLVLTTDPLVDAVGGDYHLVAGSEAIDAGTAVGAPGHDIEGAPRPQGAAHDVGAYEAN
ncbi:MAG: choice-of-anchor Q domain-containing protein, partial [Planctomycetota bacterium]